VNGNRDLFVMDASGRKVTQVTNAPREELAPLWAGPNTLVFTIFPDSTFVVNRTAKGWDTPRFVFRGGLGGALETSSGWKLFLVAGPGQICPSCAPGAYVTGLDLSNPLPLKVPKMAPYFAYSGAVAASTNKDVFAAIAERDGSTAIWRVPLNGKTEERILRFTDPARSFFRGMYIGADSSEIYFVLGNVQSDIWSMQLKKQ
jgi:Tol biopolymer transport system component